MSSLPIYADANQGWKDKKQLDLVYWLQEQNVQSNSLSIRTTLARQPG
ncbi:MAG: hypothetical protein R2778_11990 [Saprospiraceae bacterium]